MQIKPRTKLGLSIGTSDIHWPLTEIATSGKNGMSDFWPKISLVTPSYNQGKFIEETILSVLGQGYPNLEYIIIDGGSSDHSVDIISNYSKHLAYWSSEPDSGQSSAINKGFKLATGEIVGWLNSDDILLPFALWKVGLLLGFSNALACSGNEILIDQDSNIIGYRRLLPLDTKWLLAIGNFCQPTVFWKRKLFDRIGFLGERLHYAMDYDFILRISSIAQIYHVDDYIAAFRYHRGQKTSNKEASSRECALVSAQYIDELFGNYSEFQSFCNLSRLREMVWYLQTGQIRRMAHVLKRFFKSDWRKQ